MDADGNVIVSGRTDSPNFPTTAGSFDTSFNGGVDAFVTKLNVDGGTLDYSTYLGGTGDEIDQGFDKLARQVVLVQREMEFSLQAVSGLGVG